MSSAGVHPENYYRIQLPEVLGDPGRLNALLPRRTSLRVTVQPTEITVGKEVTVVVFAVDGETGVAVMGDVNTYLPAPGSLKKIGSTFSPFTYTFTGTEAGIIKAPGYSDQSIPFQFRTTPAPVDNAAFVSQSIQREYLSVGRNYGVSVTMENTGSTTWTSSGDHPYRLGSQNPQDNGTWGIGRVDLPSSVAPGAQVTFNFTITAPSSPGIYAFQWKMVREQVAWFGIPSNSTEVEVKVPQLRVWVEPETIPLNQEVMVTVLAHAPNDEPLFLGRVMVEGTQVGVTNVSFLHIFRIIYESKYDPVTGEWIQIERMPEGHVVAEGFWRHSIPFKFW
jgi:hypothetical protein